MHSGTGKINTQWFQDTLGPLWDGPEPGISSLLLYNKLSWNLEAKKPNVYYLPVSMGQESGSGLLGYLWLKDRIVAKLLPEAAVFSKRDCGWRIHNVFLFVWGPQSLTIPHGYLHRIALNMTTCFPQCKWSKRRKERKREWNKQRSHSHFKT